MSADMYGDIKNISGDVKTTKISRPFHRINGISGIIPRDLINLDKSTDILYHPPGECVVKFDS